MHETSTQKGTLNAVQFDFVVVFFKGELDLLRLQARSFDRFVAPEMVRSIQIILNDRDQAAGRKAAAQIIPEYGRFASLVKIVSPEEILGPKQNIKQSLQRFWIKVSSKVNKPGIGWRARKGWRIQQAWKLLSVRSCTAPYVVVLDCKNHFVRDITADYFIDQDGKARSRDDSPSGRLGGWVRGSFKVLGAENAKIDKELPPSVTPVVYPRGQFLKALEFIEARLGPLDLFFSGDTQGATEFTLLYAAVEMEQGGWWSHFTKDLEKSATIFRSAAPDTISRLISSVETGGVAVFAVHRARLNDMPDGSKQRIAKLWTERGLMSEIEAHELLSLKE